MRSTDWKSSLRGLITPSSDDHGITALISEFIQGNPSLKFVLKRSIPTTDKLLLQTRNLRGQNCSGSTFYHKELDKQSDANSFVIVLNLMKFHT